MEKRTRRRKVGENEKRNVTETLPGSQSLKYLLISSFRRSMSVMMKDANLDQHLSSVAGMYHSSHTDSDSINFGQGPEHFCLILIKHTI